MKCTDSQLDILKEMIGIGIGNGASVLNTMLDSHVHLEVPSLKILSPKEFRVEMEKCGTERLSSVNLPFKGIFSGVSELVFPYESASRFIAAFTHEETDDTDINSIRAGTLSEIGNIVLNAVTGSVSNILGLKLTYSIPNYAEGDFNTLLPFHTTMPDTNVLLAHTHFEIGDLAIKGNIILFFEVGSFDKLLEIIDANMKVGNDDCFRNCK